MTLQARLEALATALGTDVKTLTTRMDSLNTSGYVVIESTDTEPPPGTPVGTVVFRKQA